MRRIHILTGPLQSGKTSLCLAAAEAARSAGLLVGGLASPAVFEGGAKTAIEVLDLKTRQRRRLAELKGRRSSDLETTRWAFLPEAVEWGSQVLLQAVPCDLLLIDELGPLEFFQERGWANAFQILETGEFQAGLVVIRPSLLEEACRRWNAARVLDLGDPSLSSLSPGDLVRELLPG